MKQYGLHCGDSIEYMRNLPTGSVDLVLTDPPYSMTPTGNSCRPNYMPGGQIISGKIPNTEEWMREVYRVLKPGTHFYTFCNRNDMVKYLNTAIDVGFDLHNIVNMIKDTNMPNRWYLKYTEPVLFFKKGKAKPIRDMTSRDYEFVTMPKRGDKLHPTEKPIGFISKLLTNSSDEGDVVLDPFMGCGTTGVAAIRANRKFIGCEINSDYFTVAEDRIADEYLSSF